MSELPRPSKPVSASRTEQVHIVMPADVNGSYTRFGGILMPWIIGIVSNIARLKMGMVMNIISCEGLLIFCIAVKNLNEQ